MNLSKLKKTVLCATLAFTLLGATPKKAEAGVILAVSGAGLTASILPFVGSVLSFAVGEALWTVNHANDDPTLLSDTWAIISLGFIALDVDGTPSEDALARTLKDKYAVSTGIENDAVFSAIAKEVNKIATTQEFVDGKKMISIPETFTVQFADYATHPAAFQQMIVDLK